MTIKGDNGKAKRDNLIPNDLLRGAYELVQAKLETKEAFSKLIGLTIGYLSSKKGGFPSDNNNQGILTKEKAALIHICTGQSFINLCLDKKKEAELLKGLTDTVKDRLFTRQFVKGISDFHKTQNPNINVHILSTDTDVDGYAENYLNYVLPYFKAANSSVKIVETLFKGSNKNPTKYLTGYRDAHYKIYSEIYEALKKKKIKYVRVMSLSPSKSIHPKASEEDIVDAFLLESSLAALVHIQHCLTQNYSSLCHFYISKSTRFRHQCCIDERTLLTEDYVKNDDFIAPDLLTIDDIEVDKNINKMYVVFKKLIKPSGLIPISLLSLNKKRIDELINKLKIRNEIRKKIITSDEIKNDIILDKYESKVIDKELSWFFKNQKNLNEILNRQYKTLGKKKTALYR